MKWLRLNWNYWARINSDLTTDVTPLAYLGDVLVQHFAHFDGRLWSLQVPLDHLGRNLLELSRNLGCNHGHLLENQIVLFPQFFV